MASVLLAVATALLAAEAYGQMASTTSLVGSVTDESGKPIPGARILAVKQGWGDTYATLTHENGYYNIEFIQVGTFNLIVESRGFQRFEKTGIVVENDEIVRNDITLALASLSQSMSVEGSMDVLQTD